MGSISKISEMKRIYQLFDIRNENNFFSYFGEYRSEFIWTQNTHYVIRYMKSPKSWLSNRRRRRNIQTQLECTPSLFLFPWWKFNLPYEKIITNSIIQRHFEWNRRENKETLNFDLHCDVSYYIQIMVMDSSICRLIFFIHLYAIHMLTKILMIKL